MERYHQQLWLTRSETAVVLRLDPEDPLLARHLEWTTFQESSDAASDDPHPSKGSPQDSPLRAELSDVLELLESLNTQPDAFDLQAERTQPDKQVRQEVWRDLLEAVDCLEAYDPDALGVTYRREDGSVQRLWPPFDEDHPLDPHEAPTYKRQRVPCYGWADESLSECLTCELFAACLQARVDRLEKVAETCRQQRRQSDQMGAIESHHDMIDSMTLERTASDDDEAASDDDEAASDKNASSPS